MNAIFFSAPTDGTEFVADDVVTATFRITGTAADDPSAYTMVLYRRESFTSANITVVGSSKQFEYSDGSWVVSIQFRAGELGISEENYVYGCLRKNLGWESVLETTTIQLVVKPGVEFIAPTIEITQLYGDSSSVTIVCDVTTESSGYYSVVFSVTSPSGIDESYETDGFSMGGLMSHTFDNMPSEIELSVTTKVIDHYTEEEYARDTGSITLSETGAFVKPTIEITDMVAGASSVSAACYVTVWSAGLYYVRFHITRPGGITYTYDTDSFSGSCRLSHTFVSLPSQTEMEVTVTVYEYGSEEYYDSATGLITTLAAGSVEKPTITLTTFKLGVSAVTLACDVVVNSPGTYYVEFYIELGEDGMHGTKTYRADDFSFSCSLSHRFEDLPSYTYVWGSVTVYSLDAEFQGNDVNWGWTLSTDKRPPDYNWGTTVGQGAIMSYKKISDTKYEVYPLAASEWNGFIHWIGLFADYLGIITENLDSLRVTAGDPFTIDTPERARQIIATFDPPVAVPPAILSGRKITAAFINGLTDSLNSIV